MTYRPNIRSQADLERAWQHLLYPRGSDADALWLMLIDADDVPIPMLTRIACPAGPPEADHCGDLTLFLARIADDAGGRLRVAFLRSRPGAARPTPDDHAWALCLRTAAAGAGLACEPVHLAAGGTIFPLTIDDESRLSA